jgi:hypothetical protein
LLINQEYFFLPQLHLPMLYLLTFALAQCKSLHGHRSEGLFLGQKSSHAELPDSKQGHLDEADFAG